MHHLAIRLMSIVVLLTTALGSQATPGVIPDVAAVDWQPCPTADLPTRECGTLSVPLDYDEPDSESIAIAVARVPATDTSSRIGSLFLNPGGPGGPGVGALPLMYRALPAPLPARFDVVGFDPRGIGESTPVRCFDSIEEQAAFFAAMPSVPIGAEEVAARQNAAEDLTRRCVERNADILPHLSTANVARDMDRLRMAVGDEQVTYLGASYGTYLGATYANLFPGRIRAMVLDGVIDPPSYTNAGESYGDVAGPDTNAFLRILSNEGSAKAFDEFIDECVVAGPARCAFAEASVAETRAKFDTLMAELLEHPIVVYGPAGTVTVTYSVVVETVRGALYAAASWTGLGQGLQHLADGDAAGFLAATNSLGAPLPAVYHNPREGQQASNCLDADHPSDPAAFEGMVRRADERTPYFGAAWAYLSQPCLSWPADDDDRYTGPWDAETSETILLISRMYDPATPHSSAQAAAQSLGNARLLTIDGWGHSYFEGGLSTCANTFMAAYLIDRELPPTGTVCAEDVPPFRERPADERDQATPVPSLAEPITSRKETSPTNHT